MSKTDEDNPFSDEKALTENEPKVYYVPSIYSKEIADINEKKDKAKGVIWTRVILFSDYIKRKQREQERVEELKFKLSELESHRHGKFGRIFIDYLETKQKIDEVWKDENR